MGIPITGFIRIYSGHPVYGAYTLVYIGKADGGTFAARFSQPDRIWMREDFAHWEDNAQGIRIHTGRIHMHGNKNQPTARSWSRRIALAERLLIYAHSPAWNATGVFPGGQPEGNPYRDVHVMNWGQYGRLLPEVSGARLTKDAVFNKLWNDPLTL